MSTHVIGIKPPNEQWEHMKAVYDACHLAGVMVPTEVDDFFNGETPDPLGVIVEIEKLDAVTEWIDQEYGSASGFEVDLSKLPKDITVLRFFNSW